ncbi:ABC-three component system protein [Methylobacterium aquaticum]|uniref:ABC-three component system protein n=1 Tax=Methylobacterium aquaticum TaxID=270351 RepID=UPI003D167DAB
MMHMFGGSATQRDISAQRDNAGGNITNSNSNNQIYNLSLGDEKSPIFIWMKLLDEEIKTDQFVGEFIDTLQMYHERHSHDGIDGLEAKLKHSGRISEISLALRKKELFTRLLAKYSMFDSAQQIFAYLLAKVEQDFRSYVLPNIDGNTAASVDHLFGQFLIGPCASEIKSGVFCLNAAIAAGMVYWLAEQCYIRWHA